MLLKATKKDKERSEQFYKLVKYVKKNKDSSNDPIVKDFVQTQGYDPDLIDIPEEFEDLPIADLKQKDLKRKKSNKKFLRVHGAKSIAGYDAWRCHDRSVHSMGPKQANVAKFLIAPSLLLKTFGIPDEGSYGFFSTGEYNFEDNNLDCYRLFEYKQTDHYHGLNREDEYYQSQRNLKRPFHKRKRKRPTVQEFWHSDEPFEFRLTADDQA